MSSRRPRRPRRHSGRAARHVQCAEAAFAAGKCLRAGQEIDRAYTELGRRPDKGTMRRLKKVDVRFERACVRARPLAGTGSRLAPLLLVLPP